MTTTRAILTMIVLLLSACGEGRILDPGGGGVGADAGDTLDPDGSVPSIDAAVLAPDAAVPTPDAAVPMPDAATAYPINYVRANKALAEWQIGLEQHVVASQRNPGDDFTAANPKLWMAVSDPGCNQVGIPDHLRNGGCGLVDGVIGVCSTRTYLTGEIVDATLIMLDAFQNGDAAEGDKQQVFTHEVGHCLGLRHTDDLANVMYPDVGSADRPSAAELAAIAEAYNPPRAPSPAVRDGYFNLTEGQARRHHTEPTFVIHDALLGPTFAPAGAVPPPGPALTGPVIETIHTIRADGTCAEHTRVVSGG